MAKKARAEAKRQKRFSRSANGGHSNQDAAPADSGLTNAEIMVMVEDLHQRYDDGLLDLDTFDEQRAFLMAQISVD